MAKMTDWNRERGGWWMGGEWGWKRSEQRRKRRERGGKIWWKWE